MSELKEYKVYTTINGGACGYHYEPNPNKDQSDIKLNDKQVYLKTDVDKVMDEKDKEIRRHKYKRCLAMAEWCDTKGDWYYSISGFSESLRDRVDFYIKWRDKWRELAEQFKEAK